MLKLITKQNLFRSDQGGGKPRPYKRLDLLVRPKMAQSPNPYPGHPLIYMTTADILLKIFLTTFLMLNYNAKITLMEENIVKIISVEPVTHNVKRFRIEKPAGYIFHPGQATDVSVNTPSLVNEKHPFTFTALEEDPNLEFTIKIYEERHGVTAALGKLKPGDELVIGESWGAIEYKGAGVFIAGGAGVTPFIAIIRRLYKDNKTGHNLLIFSNKTFQDIILREEFSKMLGNNFINTLTAEKVPGYDNRRIDGSYIREKITNFNQPFYICGPDPFVKEISDTLVAFGANPESVVFEK